VALAGTPNVGKSTVFNLLTGLSQHVGNWPGKTVEQKTGVLRHNDLTIQLVDLPGTYSLTANSLEEQIARDYLAKEKPDLAVVVLNAASLERNLYFVAEMSELCPRLLIALNMMDVAQQEGIKIDSNALQSALNIPVIPLIARKNQGVKELADAIAHECKEPSTTRATIHIEAGKDIEADIAHVEESLTYEDTAPYPRHWAAMKLLEGDSQIGKLLNDRLPPDRRAELDSFLSERESAAITMAGLRFDWVRSVLSSAQEYPSTGRISLTERLDRAATHPILGLVLLLGVMGLVFLAVYGIGVPLQHFLQVSLIERVQNLISFNPVWLQSLLANGILGGVGTVLTFIPIIFLFFMAWGLMEDIGYTARVAFVTDRYMHLIGLHGKSSLPLILGFGCNVPAVMGTRIIESKRARILTVLLAPFMPCTARMAVVAAVAAAVFGGWAIVISLGAIAFSLVVLAISGLIIGRFIMKGKRDALMIELPLYHSPCIKTIGLSSWQRTEVFIKRAGTVIVAISLVIWLLSYFPGGGVEHSYLADIGRWLEPVGRLMGLNWQLLTALLTSFMAKENTIATLGVLLGQQHAGLTQALHGMLTPAAAIAFIVAQVLFIPCAATAIMIRREIGWRWMAFSIGFQLALSFSLAILVFQIAKLVGIGV